MLSNLKLNSRKSSEYFNVSKSSLDQKNSSRIVGTFLIIQTDQLFGTQNSMAYRSVYFRFPKGEFKKAYPQKRKSLEFSEKSFKARK